MLKIKKIIFYLYFKLHHFINTFKNFRKTHYCPVCNSKIKYFIPLPKHYKNNIYIANKKISYLNAETLNYDAYTCSKCGASDRERLYALFFKKYILPFYNIKNMKLVHFAPEDALKRFLKNLPFETYRTADLMMKHVDDYVDLTRLEIYSTHSFDFFICSHMLEHIIDDQKAIHELFRILKTSGKGILMVPILLGLEKTYEDFTIVSEKDRLKHFGQEDHVRVYSKRDYIKLLSDVGFRVKEYTVNDFSKEEFLFNGIDLKSVLYIVEKI
jgi:predicted SAM-dependent methyltransferase